jgi:acyl transferase domain-containing protein/aryl carrier-like protein/SAM-dependent methyltransferase
MAQPQPPQTQANEPIAIIGMACRFPGANDPGRFWSNLAAGIDSVTEIPRDRWRWEDVFGDPKKDVNKTNSRWGGFIDGIDQFDPLFFQMSPAEANFVDPQHRLFLEAAWRAVEDAGYRIRDLADRPIGVYAGVSKNDYAEMLGADLPAFVSTGTVHSILANRVSFLLNLRGPSLPIDTACSSSLVALHYAVRDLRDGTCEAALVGGVNALLSPRMYISHAKSGMLSPRGRCRTFDAGADGYVRGEGVGVVFLKPLGRAAADGDRILGIIAATAINHGGRANFLTAPNVAAQRDVVLQALRSSGAEPRSVRYIEAHGTGTPLGDPIEIEALKQAFTTRLAETGGAGGEAFCALGSVKTNIGHLESAAGMASLIKAVQVLRHRSVPKLLHFASVNPHIELAGSPFFLADGRRHPAAEDAAPWHAGVSGFGMGGVNAHVLLREPPPVPPAEPCQGPLPFLFSARRGRLRDLVTAHRDFLRTPAAATIQTADIAFTLAAGRDAFEERCAVVAESVAELADGLTAFLDGGHALGLPAADATGAGRDAAAVAGRWVEGGEPDLDPRTLPGRRVSLPGHPFSRRSCWFAARPDAAADEAEGFAAAARTIEISADDPLLRDHRVQSLRHLPAVGFLRLVADCVAPAGAVEIADTYWLQPLSAGDAETHVSLTLTVAAGGAFRFDSGVQNCRGIARRVAAAAERVSVADAVARCAHTEEAAAVYACLGDHGLDYGPSFRVLARVHLAANEAVGVVAPHDSEPAGLWDAAMQVAAFLSIRNGTASAQQFVPFHVDSFVRHADMAGIGLIHVRQRPGAGDGAVLGFDIDCASRDGTCLARFRNFTKRAYVRPPAAVPPAAEEMLLYRYAWRRSPVADTPGGYSAITPVLIGAPLSLATAMEEICGQPPTQIAWNPETIEQDLRTVFAGSDWERRPWLLFAREPGEADLLRLLDLAQRLIAARPRGSLRLKYVGQLGAPVAAAGLQAAAGFARTLSLEYPRLRLDIAGFRDSLSAASLLAEAAHEPSPLHAAEWHDGARHELEMRDVAPPAGGGAWPLRRGGTCLISGGTGGLGRALAQWLAATFQARIVLFGRRSADAAILRQVAGLKALGGDALYLQADSSDGEAVAAAAREARRAFGAIHAVVHAAGLIEDGFILRKDAASFVRVLRPKMQGAVNLDNATSGDPLDLFVCISSVAAVMPNQGQCDYASANAFLDHFMLERAQRVREGERSGLSLSLNLPLLADGGIKVGPRETAQLAEEFGMRPLPTPAALDLFRDAVALAAGGGIAQLLGIAGDRRKIARHLHVEEPVAAATDLSALVRRDLAALLAGQFRRPPAAFGAQTSLRELGMDSLAVAMLTGRLNRHFGIEIKPMLFFQEDRPEGIVSALLADHGAALSAAYARLGPLAPLHRTHSLIDPDRLDAGNGHFLRRVTNREFYMVDHVVDGLFNVPGACYLEMARQAGAWHRLDAPLVRMTDTLWARQLSSGGPAFDAHIALRDDGPRVRYEIYSEDSGGSRTVHATGMLEYGAVAAAPPDLPLAAIRARCAIRRDRAEVYRQIHAEGLHVGESFMPMADIVLSETEALATLRLPEGVAATLNDYLLHPTLLTGAFQTALINNRVRDGSARQFIPVAIGSLEIHGLVPAECLVHSVCRTGPAGGDLAKFDLRVADTQGRVMLTLSDFTIMARGGTVSAARDAGPAEGARHAAAIRFLQECLAPVIGLRADEIDPAAPFRDYGVNSLMIIDLNRRMEEVFGTGLSKTLFFEYQTLAELAGYFLEQHAAALPLPPAGASAPEPASPVPEQPRAASFAPHPAIVAARPPDAEDGAIAVIGMALRFPQAGDAASFWQLLSEGRDCIRRMPPERAALNGVVLEEAPRGGYLDEVDGFDPLFFNITPREAAQIDPQERLFLQVAWHALEDAGTTRAALAKQAVGVFAGALWQPYLEIGIHARAAGYDVAPSSLLYSIANRVSYVGNFHGPSLAVDTACSSSLTALHLACQSLATGESDLALAGGVNLSLGAGKQLFLSKNNFLSKDGRCRSFGEGGTGYVPGEGAGVVVLEKLTAAKAAGRRIHGIIRATAVNHGGRTNGYTVPNPQAQSALIRKALHKAGVDARTLSYLEAHGTGTELGDPIEITGLTQAFRDWTADNGFCAIGSVKSNFGHLEAAAGVAGLIKVLLQMQRKALVPSLHASATNPHIDFTRTPFTVQQVLTPWAKPMAGDRELPRRAGLSSFGAGGSNAHAIVEEYEAEPSPSQRRGRVVVPLSARTPERLRAAAGNLLHALDGIVPGDLDSVAYTLQTGREAFECRAVFVSASMPDLRAQLERFLDDEQRRTADEPVATPHPLLHLLRRDGAMERLLTQWAAEGEVDKLAEAWKLGVEVDWAALWPSPPGLISLPGYPFASERHWLTDGVHRRHAVAPPAGSAPQLLEAVEPARGWRYRIRLSGEEPYLTDHVVHGRRTLPAAGYLAIVHAAATGLAPADTDHAVELADVLWPHPCTAEATGLVLSLSIERTGHDAAVFTVCSEAGDQDAVPFCSGVIRWRRSDPLPPRDVRELPGVPARRESAAACYDRFHRLGLSYGTTHRCIVQADAAGSDVLVRLDAGAAGDTPGLPLLPGLLDSALQAALLADAELDRHSAPPLPFALASAVMPGPLQRTAYAWARPASAAEGVDIDLLAADGEVLGTLRGFCLRRPGHSAPGHAAAGRWASRDARAARIDAPLLVPYWAALPSAPATMDAARCDRGTLLVIGDAPAALVSRIGQPFAAVTRADAGGVSAELACTADHILYWLAEQPAGEGDCGWAEAGRTFHLLKSSLSAGCDARPVEWTVVSRRAGGLWTSLSPDMAACHALLRSAAAEHPAWTMRIIEIGPDAPLPEDLLHLTAERPVPVWRVDAGEYFQQQLVPLAEPDAFDAMPDRLRRGGVYLVIGGAGGIGAAWSEHAIRGAGARLVWIGRRPLSAAIQSELDRLGTLGTAPLYVQADAADADALGRAREAAMAHFGAIDGIVHSALVLDDAPISAMETGQFERVMAAKAETCHAIEQVFRADPPELVIFFSSINAFAAPAGQANYAAASHFADCFAKRLAERWNRTVKTINWGFWGSVGVVAAPHYRDSLFRRGFGSIEPEAGFRALDALLRSPFDQLAFVPSQPGDEAARRFFGSGAAGPVVLDQIVRFGTPAAPVLTGVLTGLGDFERTATAAAVTAAVSELLGVRAEDLDPAGKLADYGLDAAGLAALQARLRSGPAAAFDQGRITGESTLADLVAGAASEPAAASGVDEAVVDGLARRLVRSLLGAADLWDALPPEAPPYLRRWHAETRRQLIAIPAEDTASVWAEWLALPAPAVGPGTVTSRLTAYLHLLRLTLPALTDILRGTRRATDVLFPDATLREVERVYRLNDVAQRLNKRLAAVAAGLLREHRRSQPGRAFRIVELGAGTGATTESVFQAFDAAQLAPDAYVFTDVSAAFLTAAQDRYGRQRPYLDCQVLDVEADVWRQTALAAGSFDLAIATNVLHATRRVRSAIGTVKALLRPGGTLLLHELIRADFLNHLTFGLLAGWWDFADSRRLPGGPLLCERGWRDLLGQSGFGMIRRLGVDVSDPGQAVFAATSDGIVAQPVTRRDRASEPAAVAVAAPSPAAPGLAGTRALVDLVRDAVARVTRIPREQLRNDDPFETYGVDSIVRMSLQAELERGCGPLPKTLLFEKPSIAEVAAYLASQGSRPVPVPGAPDAGSSSPPPALEPVPPVVPPVRLAVAPKPATAAGMAEPIAIIGMSGRYPGAGSLGALWRRLAAGESCMSAMPPDRRDPSAAHGAAYGGFIDDVDRFDHDLFRFGRDDAAMLAPEVRLFLETAWLAFENGGYGLARLKQWQQSHPDGVGVFVASMYDQSASVGAAPAAATGGNLTEWMIANRVSHFFDLHGPSLAINTACSGSLTAVHLACESLRGGGCAMALAGGVNLTLLESKFDSLRRLGFLASGDASRSFGQGDGFLPGEGVGAVLLKPLGQAVADGDRIDAVIRASHISHSGGRQSFFAPERRAQTRLIVEVLRRAAIPPASITYVEAAANGSEMADALEAVAIAEALHTAGRERPCAVGSVKSNLGHLEAASGMSQIAKVVMQMARQTLVPSLFATPRNPHVDFAQANLAVQETLAPWPVIRGPAGEAWPRRCLINSFGAGGAYAAMVVEEFVSTPAAPLPADGVLLRMSDADPERLRRRLARLRVWLDEDGSGEDLAAVAATAAATDGAFRDRVAVLAVSRAGLMAALGQAVAAASPSGLFEAGLAPGVADGLRRQAADWLSGAPLEDVPAGPPVRLPPYPFDHSTRFPPGADHQAAADPFEAALMKIRSGSMTEAEFVTLMQA